MSNFKKHFFHISKSWFSVCTFIFLLAVCVGLAIHVISKKENAICSDSDNSELPIVSNENVSEGSGSDIEYGYTDKEIAKRVGISETAVSSRATRGRTLLREIVEKEGFCV